MKQWIFVAAIALIGAGCSDIGNFTVEQKTGEVLVEGSNSPINDLLPDNVLPPLGLDFDLQSELEERDADGAEGVYLNALTLTTTDTAKADETDEDNFDFLSKVEFYVESRKSGTELERVLVGSVDPVPTGVETLDVDVDNTINLKPYAQEGLRITTSGNGSVPPDDVTIEGNVVIEVEVF